MRPAVSQANMERIESYQGEHFDDKLGTLLLRAKMLENDSQVFKDKMCEWEDKWLESRYELEIAEEEKSIWKSAAIILAAICIGLIVYIGVGL